MNSPFQHSSALPSTLPPGYLQAAGDIGRQLGGGIASLGQNIAGAIEKYQKAEQERQVLGPQIGQFIKQDPTLAQDLDPKLLDKFQNGKASVDDHKALMGEIATNMLIKQKKNEDERNRMESERIRLQLDEAKRRQANDKLLGDSLKMNTDTDGNVDINGAMRMFIGGGGSVQDSGIAPALSTIRGLQFGGPKASSVTTDSGRNIDVLETAPGNFHLLPEQKPEANKPESPIGKLQFDRDAALMRGDKNDATQLQSAIDSEVKKLAEGNGAKALTADQSNALNFTLRLRQNEDFLAKNKYDATAFWNGSWTPERLQSDDKKAYDAAKNNWIAAALRKESGAAISAKEYEDFDKQYFPQPGDGKDVIAQKNAMRSQVARAMSVSIGPDADKYMSAAALPATQQATTRKFNSAAEAAASGYKGAAEIYDPASKKWRKAVIE